MRNHIVDTCAVLLPSELSHVFSNYSTKPWHIFAVAAFVDFSLFISSETLLELASGDFDFDLGDIKL